MPSSDSQPEGITVGPDGALWIAEFGSAKIGRATVPLAATFFTGEVWLGSGVNYLQLPDANLFGYYTFVANSIFYHYDMGYEAFIPGSASDIYLYDFTSGHWIYTSSSLFPYLYDFTLNTWIYYFQDTKNAGHYTTNPRYFCESNLGRYLHNVGWPPGERHAARLAASAC